jgi:hypothetical protein
MKRMPFLTLCALLVVCLTLVSCATPPAQQPSSDPLPQTPDEQPDTPPDTPEEPVRTDFRVVITSDVHCTHLVEWYGVPYQQRMQHWVDALTEEHEKTPIDLLIIAGDVSLDHWVFGEGGSWLSEGYSSSDEFYVDYVYQLPHDIPVIMMPGNHEQYSGEQWEEIAENERQEYYVLGNNLFLMLDTFRGELDPDYHHDGVYVGVYMKYIHEILKEHGDKDIWLISHYFDMEKESEAFKKFLRENPNVMGLFQGHTHECSIIDLGAEYNYLNIAQTGHFSYTNEPNKVANFWGFRDLIITEDGARSEYVVVESEAVIDGKTIHIERQTVNAVNYVK